MDSTAHDRTPPAPLQFCVEPTLAERFAQMRIASRHATRVAQTAGRSGQVLPSWLVNALLAGAGAMALIALRNHTPGPWWLTACLASVVAYFVWNTRRMLRALAHALPERIELSVQAGGLRVVTPQASSEIPWSGIVRVELDEHFVTIALPAQALALPRRALDPTVLEAFVQTLQAQVPAELAPAPPARPAGSGIAGDLLRNLRAGLGLALFRASAAEKLRVSLTQYLLLFALGSALDIAFDFWRVGADGQFAWWAIPAQWQGVPLALLAVWGAAQVSGRNAAVLAGMMALAALGLVFGLAQDLLMWVPALQDQEWGPLAFNSLFGLYVLASMVALTRVFATPAEQRVGVILAVLLLYALPGYLLLRPAPLWQARYDDAAHAAQRAREQAVVHESVLYAQPALLAKALDAVQPGTAGVPELFLVSVAGHGSQDVFMREVRAVDRLFAERFGTAGRSLMLINNLATATEAPMASVHALGEALRRVGARMDRNEDVLFLFLTSHGAQDFRFNLELGPYRFDELTPQRLRGLLDAAGIQRSVIVVSACYSGGFVPVLAGPTTLVMSAARADRSSHGCSHEAEWTFFGRAYFDEALRGTRDFVEGFAKARTAVALREREEGIEEASEPQIAGGEALMPALTAIHKQLEP